jgi:hypothetical protein
MTVRRPPQNSKDDISCMGPHLSCNLTRVIRELYYGWGTAVPPIKGLLPFRQKTRYPDPLQHVNHSSTLLTPCNSRVFICSRDHLRTGITWFCRPYYLPVQKTPTSLIQMPLSRAFLQKWFYKKKQPPWPMVDTFFASIFTLLNVPMLYNPKKCFVAWKHF